MSNRNRDKGHRGERYYRTYFRNLSTKFAKCITSREGSKLYDDSKIDLMFLPINFQIKTGVHRGMKPARVLKELKLALENPQLPDSARQRPCALIHKTDGRLNQDCPEVNEIVSMTFKDFIKLFKLAYLDETNH